MHKQIKDLFSYSINTLSSGLWFSGYKGEGEYKEWYVDGKLYIHCFYKDNLKDGEYKEWNYNGKLIMRKLFKDGKIIKNYL